MTWFSSFGCWSYKSNAIANGEKSFLFNRLGGNYRFLAGSINVAIVAKCDSRDGSAGGVWMPEWEKRRLVYALLPDSYG
jgi:hypothetical protein